MYRQIDHTIQTFHSTHTYCPLLAQKTGMDVRGDGWIYESYNQIGSRENISISDMLKHSK